MMLSSGENPLWVAQQMGHSDTKMIFRHYGKWIPDDIPDGFESGQVVCLMGMNPNVI